MAPASKKLSYSAVAAYLCVCVALLFLLGLTMWGSYRDMQSLRAGLLEAEIDRIRSHAQRTVGRIERELEVRSVKDLEDFGESNWLRRYWKRVIPREERRRAYAAVVSPHGDLLAHSVPSKQGKQLPRNWYNRVLFEVGEDVVETQSPALALSELAYDVRVPIELDGGEIGDYHSGFDVHWFEQRIQQTQTSFLRRRALLLGSVISIVLLATASLYYIAWHSVMLRRAVDSASIARATEVGKVAGGLAHEIRNPLHAILMNLHSLRRVHEQEAELPAEEITKMLDQSSSEIARIEQLLRQLTGFAAPDEPRNEVIDLNAEVRDVVDFISHEMMGRDITLKTSLPASPVWVQMDRGRLRQVMLNLLQNAQQAMKEGGNIHVGLSSRRGRVELTVVDDGPGVPAEDRERIFEPFYSTKQDGTGLGLSLVKRFIDEVDGEVDCEANAQGGVTLRVKLPEASPPRR
jgi:signal transduction histidine kinase